jgi:hypothetical protein
MEVDVMPDSPHSPDPKLDPRLAELVEAADSGVAEGTAPVDVLVALDVPIDDEIRQDLGARGLSIVSEVSTVLTGNVVINSLSHVAESPHVVKLEASAPLYAEPEYPPSQTDYGEGPA